MGCTTRHMIQLSSPAPGGKRNTQFTVNGNRPTVIGLFEINIGTALYKTSG